MSKVVLKQLPTLRFIAETKDKRKRRQLVSACCDKDFIQAIVECCWNVVNKRVHLSPSVKNNLSKHKQTLRDLSNKSTPTKKKKSLIQSGGFASVLPFLLGPIISGVTELFRRR